MASWRDTLKARREGLVDRFCGDAEDAEHFAARLAALRHPAAAPAPPAGYEPPEAG